MLTIRCRWFDAKKGTAIGIVFSGGGVGGVVSTLQGHLRQSIEASRTQFMPLLHQYLLDKVGYFWTLRILALYIAFAAVSPFVS